MRGGSSRIVFTKKCLQSNPQDLWIQRCLRYYSMVPREELLPQFSILILYLAQNCLASSMRLFVLSLLKAVIFGASYRTLLATCTYAVVRSGHRRGTGYLKSFIFVFFLYSTGYRNFAYNLKCLTRLCCNTVQNFLVVLNTPVIEPLELRRMVQLLNSSLVL